MHNRRTENRLKNIATSTTALALAPTMVGMGVNLAIDHREFANVHIYVRSIVLAKSWLIAESNCVSSPVWQVAVGIANHLPI
jgi:hypothetical protein